MSRNKENIKMQLNRRLNELLRIGQKKQKEKGLYIANSDLWSPEKNNKNTFKIKDDEWYFVHDDIFNPENWTQEVPQ